MSNNRETQAGYPYSVTNDSVTVVVDGKPTNVRRGAANFVALRNALLKERWDDVRKNLTQAKSITEWAKGRFAFFGGKVFFDGTPVPETIQQRMREMAAEGGDPGPLFRFWERLQKNPSMRSVEQLWPFLQHRGIPLTEDGCFLAYKGVRNDYKDQHTGTCDNSPGQVLEMPRNKISDDPNEACHYGFHVGALEYATTFSQRVVVCKVDPADVVCIPYDHDKQKMRVCRYEVVGNHNGEYLPDLVQPVEDMPKVFHTDVSGVPPAELEKVVDRVKDITEDQVVQSKKIPREYRKYLAMSAAQLLDCSLQDLRAYAANGLKIVGASKIPGGKAALVSVILKNVDG